MGLGEIVSDVTGLWLVNQAAPGLTAQHDRVSVTGTGSDATPPDGVMIAEAPDAATRNVTVAGPDGDRAALEALYRATDGANWVDNTNWLSDAPLGDWYGVNTNDSGRVTGLQLTGVWSPGRRIPHGLTGSIPPELGDLTGLITLDLGVNLLTGSIPPELGKLTNLIFLNVTGNELTGEIPAELGNLVNLRNLAGNSNDLTGGIPAELGNLNNLSILQFWDNDLSGEIPSELGNLPNHASLYLSGNRLTGAIPSELGNLRTVSLGGNELTGTLPPEFGDLGILEWLSIGGNNLTGQIPTSFLSLSLRRFFWANNAGLCAPDTAAFRTWLAGIEEHDPGPFCSGSGGHGRTTRTDPDQVGPAGAVSDRSP